MPVNNIDQHETIYSTCCHTLGKKTWGRVRAALDRTSDPAEFPELIEMLTCRLDLPAFIADMARLEWGRQQVEMDACPLRTPLKEICVNPTLRIHSVSWRHLPALIESGPDGNGIRPEQSSVHVLAWRHPQTGKVHLREADDIDLLALKMIVEGISPRETAAIGSVTVGAVEGGIDRAASQGLLLKPASRITRPFRLKTAATDEAAAYVSADSFTLQWHVTQKCDLHCKHCYDRSSRRSMPLELCLAVLDDFYDFCRSMHVAGHVTFTGGNPLLYRHFLEVYRKAADYGFGLAILGNPAARNQLERICDIARPAFYQISLEGLAEHNDEIRGEGHFERSLRFLELLKELGIFSMVMLTLTRANMDQVLPLAAELRNRADAFNFNRLSAVGEGADLAMPGKKQFESFLRAYVQETGKNPILGLKDNLINIIRAENGESLFGGCTGYGCGAAFNFVALLPDGEVHACRKFPSAIGNIRQKGLMAVYMSDAAKQYRSGAAACANCRLNTVCRGCLAVTYSSGLDPFQTKDPFCFASEAICHPD